VRKLKDDGKGRGGPIVFAIVGFIIAALLLSTVYHENVVDRNFQSRNLPFHDGPYSPPPGCPVKEWSYDEVMPHACDADAVRMPHSKYHIRAGFRHAHLIRMGHDAYAIECDLLGVPGCKVENRLVGIFAY
jgi:hypothetical protein